MAALLFIFFLISQLLPLVLFFVFFKRINKILELRVIFFYVLLSFLSNFLIGAFKNNSSQIVDLFAISEFCFFSIFFFLSIRNKKFKSIIITLIAINLGIDIFIFSLHKTNFDFWVAITTTVIMVIYSIFFFYEQVNSPQTLIIYQSYKFWCVVGCIIYLSGTLFVFLYTSDMKDRALSPLWGINFAFEIVKNICFSIAFILAKGNNKNVATQNFDDTNIFENPF